jgi:hypothetical protein
MELFPFVTSGEQVMTYTYCDEKIGPLGKKWSSSSPEEVSRLSDVVSHYSDNLVVIVCSYGGSAHGALGCSVVQCESKEEWLANRFVCVGVAVLNV